MPTEDQSNSHATTRHDAERRDAGSNDLRAARHAEQSGMRSQWEHGHCPAAHTWSQLVVVLTALLLCGCAGTRLPAIDQTGQHIFSGGSTSILPHCFHHGEQEQPCELPVSAPIVAAPPVFESPPIATTPVTILPVSNCGPVQPSCTPPIAIAPAPVIPIIPAAPIVVAPQPACPAPAPQAPPLVVQPCATDNQDGSPQLIVSPTRIVAPVGSEVILTAGLRGADGFLVMRQPLEWIVAQDGVGQIICIGKESPSGVSHVLRGSPDKLTPNYALAHTSTVAQTITRGTPNPNDDVTLQRGQSFITVSSPSEGTSYITVVAPKEHDWEKRKQIAMITWVDAVWSTPANTQVKCGQKTLLSTKLARGSGAPVNGWIVRYEVLEGPEAGFGGAGSTFIEVPTDANGLASAELLPRANSAGITTLRTQIIRPTTGRGDMPNMVVGQTASSIQWSSPGLAVRALGPSIVSADGAVSYRIEVSNTGDQPTKGVMVSFTPPPGVSVLNAAPSAQPFGDRFEWRVAELQPRQSDVIELNCRAAREADLRATFKARTADGLEAQDTVATRVFESALAVKMTGPDAVEVGKPAKFRIEVTNTGSGPLSNVTISDVFDPGLRHAQGESSPIVKSIGELAPGETKPMGVTFVVSQAGRQRHRLSVTADGGHTAGSSSAITGLQSTAPPVQIEVRGQGPERLRARAEGQYKVEVRNTGTMAANNIRIVAEFGSSLEPTVATGGDRRESGQTFLAWTIPRLQAGETVVRQLNCAVVGGHDSAQVRFTVTGEPGIRDVAEVRTTIEHATAAVGANQPSGGRVLSPPAKTVSARTANTPLPVEGPSTLQLAAPQADGALRVSLSQTKESVSLNGTTEFLISVQNDRAVSDREIALTLILPPGLKLERLSGPTEVRATSSDGRTIEVGSVTELRPGESLGTYRLELKGVRAGKQLLRAEVSSARTPSGVAAEAQTTVGSR
jgi:uncharacterized repeat protein (TIGR01451 family)